MSDILYRSAELRSVEGEKDQYEFVASDETVDRYGDIVRVDGWELKNYRANPIVLFGHQHSNPVGVSTKVWIDKDAKALMIRIKLADEGTSPFIDTLRKLVAQRIVRAVSVGFSLTKAPNEIKDPDTNRWTGGYEFVGQELLENSLVTVPANPSALSTAKSLGLPELHLRRIFSDSPERLQDRRIARDIGAFATHKHVAGGALDILRARRFGL